MKLNYMKHIFIAQKLFQNLKFYFIFVFGVIELALVL